TRLQLHGAALAQQLGQGASRDVLHRVAEEPAGHVGAVDRRHVQMLEARGGGDGAMKRLFGVNARFGGARHDLQSYRLVPLEVARDVHARGRPAPMQQLDGEQLGELPARRLVHGVGGGGGDRCGDAGRRRVPAALALLRVSGELGHGTAGADHGSDTSVILKGALVAMVRPSELATSVYRSPIWSMLKASNVATPDTAGMGDPPVSLAPPPLPSDPMTSLTCFM